jgi:hypothetical protein
MDANTTNRKTLASVLVTLLVGATLLAATAPTAEATHLGTGAQDVYIDVRSAVQDVRIYNSTSFLNFPDVHVPTNPAEFRVRHSTAYELTFVGINTTSGGYGYAGATVDVEIVNVSTGLVAVGGTPLTTGPDGPTSPLNLRNATFLIGLTSFPGPGVYELQPVGTNTVISRILVYPHEDISVAVTTNPTPLSYTGNQVVVNVATGVSGAVLSSNASGFISGAPITDPSGNYAFISNIPMGAGTWTVFATRDNNPGGNQCDEAGPACPGSFENDCSSTSCVSFPERMGSTSFVVNPTTLNRAGGSDTAFVGFMNQVTATFQAPATSNPVLRTGFNDFTVTDWNLSILTPGNFMFIRNVTGGWPATNTSFGSWTCQNLAAGALVPHACGTATPPTVTVHVTDGTLQIVNNTWQAGTYTVNLGLEVAGGASTAPEYTAAWLINAVAPAAVNLEVSPTSVDVPAPTNVPSVTGAFSSAQGTVTVALTISGDAVYRHPMCDKANVGDVCAGNVAGATWESDNATRDFRGNLTLRGDVLPGWNVTSYTSSSGIALLRFTPTANGTVFADVKWKNVTTTIAIPVNRGASITLDLENITVDATTTVTAHVADSFGNPVSNAKVFVFPRQTLTTASPTPLTAGSYQGTGATVVLGSGAAGAGAGGDYVFNLLPSTIQDLVFVAEIGSAGNLNYSYAPLTVLPTTDLTVTLNVTETMAALRTQIVLNVTNTSGAGQTANPANFKLYFLTATQRENLLTNGTTALFTTGTVPTAATMTGSSANGTVTNVTLNAGDYHVYLCSSTGAITDCRTALRDNRDSMPLVNVSAYTATFAPQRIANNPDIQGATAIHIMVVDRDGTPANGTISFRTNGTLTTSGATLTSTVTNGETNVTLTGSNTGIGELEWDFNPKEATGSDDPAKDRVLGTLSIVAGNLTFEPSRVPILQSTLVTVRLTNFTDAGLPGRVIRICSISLNANFPTTVPTNLDGTTRPNCPGAGTTGSDGSTGIVVTPTSLTELHVYVNDSYTGRTIPVTAGTLIVTVSPTSPSAGGNATITVTQPGGTPSVGSRVLVTRDGTGVLDQTANGEGKVTVSSLVAGNYTVTAIRTGFDNGTATFTVGGLPPTNQSQFVLSNLVLPAQIAVGSPVTVSVDVENTGTASGTATAILLVNNAQRDTQSVTLDAGETQTVAYTFTPTVAGTYAVSVRIGDTTVGPQNIVVGPVTTTPVTSTPVTSTPVTSTPVTTPVTTPEPTPTPTPTVSGFEVIALLGAIAVALAVIRRRN